MKHIDKLKMFYIVEIFLIEKKQCIYFIVFQLKDLTITLRIFEVIVVVLPEVITQCSFDSHFDTCF